MDNLQHAINLYKDNQQKEERIKTLKIEYVLANTKEEKNSIALTLYNYGYVVN